MYVPSIQDPAEHSTKKPQMLISTSVFLGEEKAITCQFRKNHHNRRISKDRNKK